MWAENELLGGEGHHFLSPGSYFKIFKTDLSRDGFNQSIQERVWGIIRETCHTDLDSWLVESHSLTPSGVKVCGSIDFAPVLWYQLCPATPVWCAISVSDTKGYKITPRLNFCSNCLIYFHLRGYLTPHFISHPGKERCTYIQQSSLLHLTKCKRKESPPLPH